MNLKRLFTAKPNQIEINKAEAEMLKCFMANKKEFENWFGEKATTYPKIKFHFFYPTAIDFIFDDFKLFTAYFARENNGNIVFEQFKMSDVNLLNIKTRNWKPFQTVILGFLEMLEQKNTSTLMKEQKSLYEYQLMCKENPAPSDNKAPSYVKDILSSQLNLSGS